MPSLLSLCPPRIDLPTHCSSWRLRAGQPDSAGQGECARNSHGAAIPKALELTSSREVGWRARGISAVGVMGQRLRAMPKAEP